MGRGVTASSTWQPRPGPASDDPHRPGLRPHQHPADRLYAWVFLQHQVWVDYWGNEHEIELMSINYVENVIRFSEERVERIAFLITTDVLVDAGRMLLGLGRCRGSGCAEARIALKRCAEIGAGTNWLHTLPLVRALDRRVATEKRSADA